jgi:hypothetical protein
MADELVVWLRAQIDDDEALARDATQGDWRWADRADLGRRFKQVLVAGPGEVVVPSCLPDVYPSKYDAAHIVRHDPARVLREVEAKRRIIEQYEAARDQACNPVSVKNYEMARLEQGALGDVLRLLALPYSDRVGYSGAWRP